MGRRALLWLTIVLGACGVAQPEIPLDQFAAGNYAAVRSFTDQYQKEGPVENQALVLNVQGQCDLMLGDTEAAFRAFGAAGRIMGSWETPGSETFAAVVGSESSKTWQGDPYEKVMNTFYLGMLYIWKGEHDNARAVFKKGILCDGESADEKFQTDSALLFWLSGRMSRLMGLAGDAGGFFDEARKAYDFASQHGARSDAPNHVLDNPEFGNLVLLVECGMGPIKDVAGNDRELVVFRPRAHAAQRARVTIDDQFVGDTLLLHDVDYQARTRGGTEMEGIRKGKAVFKNVSTVAGTVLLIDGLDDNNDGAAMVGAGLLLLGLLTSTEADVRHWPTLPSTIQTLCVQVPPGSHRLRLQFLAPNGAPIDGLEQNWTIDVPQVGESYYLFRSLPRARPEGGKVETKS